MLTSVLIIIFCSALLVYWFRYTCVLLLRDAAEDAQTYTAAVRSSFEFHDVQKQLCSESELDPLNAALRRDYEVLSYLLRHASGITLQGFEERMLVWDYKVMRLWYSVARTAAPEQARAALSEMASVLMILAGRIGQRAGLQSQA